MDEWGLAVYRHFQQYFTYIVAVSFIGEGNQRTHKVSADMHWYR